MERTGKETRTLSSTVIRALYRHPKPQYLSIDFPISERNRGRLESSPNENKHVSGSMEGGLKGIVY